MMDQEEETTGKKRKNSNPLRPPPTGHLKARGTILRTEGGGQVRKASNDEHTATAVGGKGKGVKSKRQTKGGIRGM